MHSEDTEYNCLLNRTGNNVTEDLRGARPNKVSFRGAVNMQMHPGVHKNIPWVNIPWNEKK